jgi:hypothetical protein
MKDVLNGVNTAVRPQRPLNSERAASCGKRKKNLNRIQAIIALLE